MRRRHLYRLTAALALLPGAGWAWYAPAWSQTDGVCWPTGTYSYTTASNISTLIRIVDWNVTSEDYVFQNPPGSKSLYEAQSNRLAAWDGVARWYDTNGVVTSTVVVTDMKTAAVTTPFATTYTHNLIYVLDENRTNREAWTGGGLTNSVIQEQATYVRDWWAVVDGDLANFSLTNYTTYRIVETYTNALVRMTVATPEAVRIYEAWSNFVARYHASGGYALDDTNHLNTRPINDAVSVDQYVYAGPRPTMPGLVTPTPGPMTRWPEQVTNRALWVTGYHATNNLHAIKRNLRTLIDRGVYLDPWIMSDNDTLQDYLASTSQWRWAYEYHREWLGSQWVTITDRAEWVQNDFPRSLPVLTITNLLASLTNIPRRAVHTVLTGQTVLGWTVGALDVYQATNATVTNTSYEATWFDWTPNADLFAVRTPYWGHVVTGTWRYVASHGNWVYVTNMVGTNQVRSIQTPQPRVILPSPWDEYDWPFGTMPGYYYDRTPTLDDDGRVTSVRMAFGRISTDPDTHETIATVLDDRTFTDRTNLTYTGTGTNAFVAEGWTVADYGWQHLTNVVGALRYTALISGIYGAEYTAAANYECGIEWGVSFGCGYTSRWTNASAAIATGALAGASSYTETIATSNQTVNYDESVSLVDQSYSWWLIGTIERNGEILRTLTATNTSATIPPMVPTNDGPRARLVWFHARDQERYAYLISPASGVTSNDILSATEDAHYILTGIADRGGTVSEYDEPVVVLESLGVACDTFIGEAEEHTFSLSSEVSWSVFEPEGYSQGERSGTMDVEVRKASTRPQFFIDWFPEDEE